MGHLDHVPGLDASEKRVEDYSNFGDEATG